MTTYSDNTGLLRVTFRLGFDGLGDLEYAKVKSVWGPRDDVDGEPIYTALDQELLLTADLDAAIDTLGLDPAVRSWERIY